MSKLVIDGNGKILQLLQPKDTHITVAVSATTAQSAAITSDALVELQCDTLCFVAIGPNPTATLTSIPIYGGTPRTLKVRAGDKIAVIGTSDTLRIVEML